MITCISKARLGALAAVAATVLAAAPASAATVTYTLAGQLDGSIGATALTGASFVWTLKANNLASASVAGFPALQAFSADLQVAGVGDAAFTQPTYVFKNADLKQFAFVDASAANGVGWTSPTLAAALLGGAIAQQSVDFEAATGSIGTSLGAFHLADATGLTFSATVTPTPPVLYTLSGAISGTLNGVAFADDPFSWRVTADTGGLSPYMGLPALQSLASALHLGGVGDLATASPFKVVVNPEITEAGFVDAAGAQGFAATSPVFAGYVLGDALADLPVNFAGALGIQTSGGLLDITSANGLTISATPLSGAPEPSSWALAMLGFAGLGAALRRNRALGQQRSMRAA